MGVERHGSVVLSRLLRRGGAADCTLPTLWRRPGRSRTRFRGATHPPAPASASAPPTAGRPGPRSARSPQGRPAPDRDRRGGRRPLPRRRGDRRAGADRGSGGAGGGRPDFSAGVGGGPCGRQDSPPRAAPTAVRVAAAGRGWRMTTVLVIRHGRTALNADGALRGRVDVPLDEVGLAEAARLGDLFEPVPLMVVVCSPLLRARQTAAPIANSTGAAVRIEEAFTDRDVGGWSGMPA